MRLVLKISGESLKNIDNIDSDNLKNICGEIKELSQKGELIIITGGGNFHRGRASLNIARATSDYIGMLGTIMNILAISSYLDKIGVPNEAYSAFDIPGIIEKGNYKKIENDLKNKKVILFGGGLGTPNLSTDMTATSKALEYNADAILMSKNIDGVYDKDPKLTNAKKIDKLTHEELLNISFESGLSNLMILDPEALVSLAKHKISLYIYNYKDVKDIEDIFSGKVGTRVIS